MKIVVLSPDNLPIRPRPFPSMQAAQKGLADWCKRFEHQGYYASASGRIELALLRERCTFRGAK